MRPFVVLPLLRTLEHGIAELAGTDEPLEITQVASIGPPGTYTWQRADGALLVSGLQFSFRPGKDLRAQTSIISTAGDT